MHRAAASLIFFSFSGDRESEKKKKRKGRNRVGWAGCTGREEGLAGRFQNTGSPSFSTRPEKNPATVRLLNGLTQQHKHTPVAVKGPSLQSRRPAGST